MGWVAFVWLLDCLAALVLTFPLMRHVGGSTGRGWWSRWKSAWGIKWTAGSARLNFDMHRALSLWVWVMLLVFAISGFALNLPSTYEKGIGQAMNYLDLEEHPGSVAPLPVPVIGWEQAWSLAQKYMADEASAQGFTVQRPEAFMYRRAKGAYFYRVQSDRDVGEQGKTTIGLDGATGAFLGIETPTGHRAGNTVTSWMNSLHMAKVGGNVWRVCVTALGLLVVILSVTGILIFTRKLKSRTGSRTIRNA